MSFHDAQKRAKEMGFGLAYEAGKDHWIVIRGREVVHQASDPTDALRFCEAWIKYVR